MAVSGQFTKSDTPRPRPGGHFVWQIISADAIGDTGPAPLAPRAYGSETNCVDARRAEHCASAANTHTLTEPKTGETLDAMALARMTAGGLR